MYIMYVFDVYTNTSIYTSAAFWYNTSVRIKGRAETELYPYTPPHPRYNNSISLAKWTSYPAAVIPLYVYMCVCLCVTE